MLLLIFCYSVGCNKETEGFENFNQSKYNVFENYMDLVLDQQSNVVISSVFSNKMTVQQWKLFVDHLSELKDKESLKNVIEKFVHVDYQSATHSLVEEIEFYANRFHKLQFE